MKQHQATIVKEYGPFPGVEIIHGLTFDGRRVWFASGERLTALDPESGETGHCIAVPAHAGTAFDGRYLYQIAGDRIQKIDPESGAVLSTIPAPAGGGDSGMAWAEGALWVGHHQGRRIYQVDAGSGSILNTFECSRMVTGVTWVEGELWHGTWENDGSDLRRIDPESGALLETIEMPEGTGVSGLESDGGHRFFCGGGRSGLVRVVERPARA